MLNAFSVRAAMFFHTSVITYVSSHSVHALLCLGLWSLLGLVKDVNIRKIAVMDGVNGDVVLPDGWDAIDE